MRIDVPYGYKCPYKKDIIANKEECSKCEMNNWIGETFVQCNINSSYIIDDLI